jgi:23S rRNA G2069 N7-methylase RlmK/C1962 C5-methylase RlmI
MGINFRYRNYKDKKLRGTYLIQNNKQMQMVSSRQLSKKEMDQLRKQMLLTEAGFIDQSKSKYEKQISSDQIKQINEDSLNLIISDIYKANGKWTKEPTKDRQYLAKDDDIENLRKVI